MNELNSVIVQILQVSPIMKIIRVKPVGWEFPEFKGGQFVALGLPGSAERANDAVDEFEIPEDGTKLIKRAYSIASTSTADYVEFYITLVHSGALTPRIFNLNIGDKIFMGKKGVGMFTLDAVNEKRNIILIATGTGVAPYMSMLRSDALKRKGNIMIIHGAANSWDLGYSSELQLLQSMFDSFSYLPTITEPAKEPAGWSGDTRFIGDIWADSIGEKKWGFKPSPENTDFFLCGNPRMIEGMVEMLEKDGFIEHKKKTPGQIHVEEF
ncbi:MAG: ferredoxin--NADP reductase [Bacteroidales bacterium]|nr:ferredoxin--NADP reductase [Bacteroidales bacterium]